MTEAPFTTIACEYLEKVKLKKVYLSHVKAANYAFVAGCGVLINTALLYALVSFFPLYLSNWIAILCAWGWNYTFSVGPFGYIFGLSEKK